MYNLIKRECKIQIYINKLLIKNKLLFLLYLHFINVKILNNLLFLNNNMFSIRYTNIL